jgi:hypothetical protein
MNDIHHQFYSVSFLQVGVLFVVRHIRLEILQIHNRHLTFLFEIEDISLLVAYKFNYSVLDFKNKLNRLLGSMAWH